MCADAAEGIKLQCDREYRFSDSESLRATQLNKLTANEFTGLPTNNLDTKCDFSKFSRLSEVARFGNRKFSAKGIQNDMTLFKFKKGEAQNIVRKVANVSNTREKQWNEKQKELSAICVKERTQKAVRQKDYVRKLLETCKSWGGPCVTSDELIAAINAKLGKQEQIVQADLTFYRSIDKSDMIARLDLFKLNKISHEEHLENLQHIACGSVTDFLTNADALKTLKTIRFRCTENNSTIEAKTNNPPEIHFNGIDSYVVAWYLGAKWQWFLGYIKEKGGGKNYLVEHLGRIKTSNDMLWKYPVTDDVILVSAEQIVHVDVKGF